MYIAIVSWSGQNSASFQARLGPTTSRDEAARLARSWMEANAGASHLGQRMVFGAVEILPQPIHCPMCQAERGVAIPAECEHVQEVP